MKIKTENAINELYQLCICCPFNKASIEECIHRNNMDSNAITRTAVKVADYGSFSFSDFLYSTHREPQEGELRTSGWEELFTLLLDYGLNPDQVTYDLSSEGDSVLSLLNCFDDGDLGARIARILLRRRGDPNTVVEYEPLFVTIDDDFSFDIGYNTYHEKWRQDIAFRFWLVLMGFGGVLRNGKCPVTMHNNQSPTIFRNFEKYDYCVKYMKTDYELYIFEKETGIVVATL